MALTTVWVVFGWAGLIFFRFSKNGRLKRRLYPFYCGIIGAFMGLFPLLVGAPPWMPLFLSPLLVGFIVLTVRSTKFCEACGATNHSLWFGRINFCQKCGVPFDHASR